ncbi:MAG: helix-turn-helix transcriptional regulator [Treponema sp.]|jgi:DNA-binding CsgD family transcriptional regulator|nr:helix-turn-helix transcriptional regulator [Treponema sp.]
MQESLTGREQEVLNLLLDGAVPKEIAFSLNISYDTVLTHQKSLYRKLEVHSINELIGKYSPDNSDEQAPKLQIRKILTFPLTVTFFDNSPWNWEYRFEPDLLFNDDEWKPSPFKLGKGNKLTKGDEYIIEVTYMSNVDLDFMTTGFADNVAYSEDLSYWTALSEHERINENIKANTKYSASIKVRIDKSSSISIPEANLLHFNAFPCEKTQQPSVTFEKLEITLVPKIQIDDALPQPLCITFNVYEPPFGWHYKITPDLFLYDNKYRPSPFKLGKGNIITEGDSYLLNFTYTPNIDIFHMEAVFVDNTIEEQNNYTPLTAYKVLGKNIKANTRYSTTLRLYVYKSSSKSVPEANILELVVNPHEEASQPILLFDNIEIVKVKI